MKCTLNITRSDVKRLCSTSIRIPNKVQHARKHPQLPSGFFGGTLKCCLDRLASKKRRRNRVLLVDTRESRVTIGVEQKRERTTVVERANKVRAHPVIVTQERIVEKVGLTFMTDAFLMILFSKPHALCKTVQKRKSLSSADARQTRRIDS